MKITFKSPQNNNIWVELEVLVATPIKLKWARIIA
jgi:hypothetical protein